MKLTISRPPLIAKNLYPSEEELYYGYRWYLDASDVLRERYHQARIELVNKYANLDAPAEKIYSSGSTGVRKCYLWGPEFLNMDKFFHRLVKDGDKLKQLAHIHLNKLTSSGEENKVDFSQLSESYNIQKNVIVSINGQGEIKGLKEEIAGWNVFVSTSSFLILEKLTNFVELIDKDALIIFTGEELPTDMRVRLRDQGLDVRDEMRCWDGGATFYTCKYGNKHWVDYLAKTWIQDGKLWSSDFFNVCQPHINYCNGDVLTRTYGAKCSCGQIITETKFVNRAETTIFKSPLGQTVTYDLVHSLVMQALKVKRDQITFLAIGKYSGEIDNRLKLHYVVEDIEGEVEDILKEEFYATFGIRITAHKYVEGSFYKIKKVYWVEDDKSYDIETGNNS